MLPPNLWLGDSGSRHRSRAYRIYPPQAEGTSIVKCCACADESTQ